MKEIYKKIPFYAEKHKEETITFLKELTSIPAPTGKEEKRAAYILDWINRQGIPGAYIDEAGNVICLLAQKEEQKKHLCVVNAHMDTVFTEEMPFPVIEDDGLLKAPGIGDDTANLVNMLMTLKFIWENREELELSYGLLFVANVGEEGLGNLKGSWAIYHAFGTRIRRWTAVDLYLDALYNSAVGSHRYRITVQTAGGHSFGNFGNANAIAKLSAMITKFYQQQVPTFAKTTYNVGMIEGGTSVNTIAQEAACVYEFRSEANDGLLIMKESFERILKECEEDGVKIYVEELGIRPGNGPVDPEEEKELCDIMAAAIQKYYEGEIKTGSASTDCNIPLSKGIPAACFGAVMGDKLHTKEEWIEKESMVTGQMIAIDVILSIGK